MSLQYRFIEKWEAIFRARWKAMASHRQSTLLEHSGVADSLADKVFISAQRTTQDGLQSLDRPFLCVHAEPLDAGHHQAHVIGQPAWTERGHLGFEGGHVITAISHF